MGGTNHEAALGLIGEVPCRYFPFPGTVVGHPSELHGSIEDIASHAAELTSQPGVGGLDLLAYRHRTVDPLELTRAVVAASQGPVVVAGSIDPAERIQGVAKAGAWAFTLVAPSSRVCCPGLPISPPRSSGPCNNATMMQGRRSRTNEPG